MSNIVVVGSLNMDLVVRVAHMPAPGETIIGDDFNTIPGGKGANQAVAAARLGGKVTMIGRTGEDGFGNQLRQNLTRENINTTHVSIDSETASGMAMITLDAEGQNSIIVVSGANMRLTPEMIEAAWSELQDVGVVVMPLEIPLECVMKTAELGKRAGAKVILNPAPARDLPANLYPRVDVIVPNESETSLLTGLPTDTEAALEAAANNLLKQGAGAIVLTLGSRGALLKTTHKDSAHIPPYPVDVVDTTAAGDAFVAGLAVSISEGLNLDEAVRIANAAGALATTRIGAQPAMPRRHEIKSLMNASTG